MKKFLMVLATLFIAALPVCAQVQIPPAVANASSTGTTVNHLVKLTGTPSTAVIAAAGDTQGIVGICDSGCGTSNAPIIGTAGVDICAFDGATTAGDYVQISATVAGDCTDTGSSAVPTSGEIIGRVLSGIGSAGNTSVLINIQNSVGSGGSGSVNAGSTGQAAVYNSSNTVTSAPLAVYPDALVAAGGVGAASVVWAASTTYPLCQLVSHSGNFLAVSSSNGSTTPGSNPHIWYPIPNGSRPTAFDCGFYIAQSLVTSAAGVTLRLGSGTYNSCIGMTYPTVSSPGLPGVNIHGAGVNSSIILQTCTLISGSGGDGLAMLNVPAASISFALPRLQFSDFTLDANNLAPSIFDLHACQQCTVERMQLQNGPDGIDHYFEAGTVGGGNRGWVYELTMTDVTTVYNPSVIGIGHGNGAFAASVTVSGGVPTITVSSPGVNYGGQTVFRLVKTGGLEACTSIGTFTPTFNGSNGISALSTTSSGCAATGLTFVQIYPQTDVNYSFTFSNMSDSHLISDLVPGGVGAKCGVNISNVTSFNSFYKLHPIGTFNGVCDQGSNNFYNTQLDTIYNWGIDEEGQENISNFYGSMFEWAASNLTGSSDYHFGKTNSPPISAPSSITIFSDACGNSPNQSGYAHLVGSIGPIDSTSVGLPSYLTIYNTQFCNLRTTNTIQYTNMAQDIIWGNGTNFNHWDWNLGLGSNTALSLSNSQASASSPSSFLLESAVAAAADGSTNVKSPIFSLQGGYGDGSAAHLFGPKLSMTCAGGAGPLCTFAFARNGTSPAGGWTWTFDAGVSLPTGSTTVTQSTGDTSTAIATDAFVNNTVALAVGAAGCQLSCSYAVGSGDGVPLFGSSTTVMTSNNVGQFVRFYNALPRTLGNGSVRVTTISAGGHFSVGVYSISGTTGTLIWTTGSQSTASAVNIPVTPTPVNLLAGTSYYLAWCADNTSAALIGPSNAGAANSFASSAAPANSYGINSTDTCTAGVLPSTITTTNISNNASASLVGLAATN